MIHLPHKTLCRGMRLTTLQLMAVVAAVAVATPALQSVARRRSVAFQKLATSHYNNAGFMSSGDDVMVAAITKYGSYHAKMAAKYDWASRYPLFPVQDDPPEPPWPYQPPDPKRRASAPNRGPASRDKIRRARAASGYTSPQAP
jgi:hypothetical protein